MLESPFQQVQGVLVGALALFGEVLAEFEEKLKGEDWLTAQLVVDLPEEVLQIGLLVEEELVQVKDITISL